jgi:hypothetical protein
MIRLIVAIRKSPKWKASIGLVACSACSKVLLPVDAYVDWQGFIWCKRCK